MRCPNCGTDNHPAAASCQYCYRPLSGGYDRGEYHQQPPEKSGASVAAIVIVVVVVIIAVFIVGSVVMAGVLYIWVTSLADTSEEVTVLRLHVEDGPANQGDGSAFEVGEQFLKIEQVGGDPIDWIPLRIYCENTETVARHELVILSIGGTEFNPAHNYESKTGQVIIFGVGSTGDFSNGDRVEITITKGDDQVYRSTALRVV